MAVKSVRKSTLERRKKSTAGVPPKGNVKVISTKAKFAIYDLLMVLWAILLASAIRNPGPDAVTILAILLATSCGWFFKSHLYTSRYISRRTDELNRVVSACLKSSASAVVIVYLADLAVSRWWLFLYTLLVIFLVAVEREIIRSRLKSLRRAGKMQRKVILIGNNWESQSIQGMVSNEKSLGYTVMDVLDPTEAGGPHQLTTLALAAVRAHEVDSVIIAASAIDMKSSNRLIRDLVEAGIHVELSSTLADIASNRLTVRALGRFPVVYIEPRNRQGWRALAKRAFDFTIACFTLLVVSPVFACLTLLVKLTSEGPVFFKQERIGKNGEPFDVLKFRTMVENAESLLEDLEKENEGSGPLFKMKDDPRITKVGSFLRKTSLDELPQLINVLKDEMSLVGPRPALKSEMAQWDLDLYRRLRVKPGITGMWQISGRSGTTFEEYTRLDLYYVDNWSLFVDVSIILRTIPAVLKSDGAY